MMFKGMLGCLFILIFGGIFFVFGIFMYIYRTLFGKRKPQRGPWGAGYNRNSGTQRTYQQPYSDSTAGNAHHETNRNSRQKRKEKIFEKNEGEYVDFEEV